MFSEVNEKMDEKRNEISGPDNNLPVHKDLKRGSSCYSQGREQY